MGDMRDVRRWEEFLLGEGYELLGQLDCGSFSDVFAVSSVHTGRALAVKRILARRSVMADPRVAAEIACLTRLRMRGSCVIGLEAAVVREGMACLLLELAPLGDLERYAATHSPLPPSLLTSVARQVTTALTHCHRLRLAHRDLHPANVLLLTPRCVRLGDLGLAVPCRDSRGRPLLCHDYLGRQAYLAPEVLRQRPYDALPADLWSLGALSAFLLTGQHPLPARPYPASSSCSAVGHKAVSPPVSFNFETKSYSTSSTTHNSGLHVSQTEVGKTPSFRSVKEFLPASPRSKRYRASSCDSDGSCRSESDSEDASCSSSPRHSTSDFVSKHPLASPFDGDSLAQSDQQSLEVGPLPWSFPETETEIPDELTIVKRALAKMVSRLCVYDPLERVSAESALEMWKQSVKRVRKS